ncbi:two-component sensor histidine kinase [Microbispora corallina]|uniref:histidine kinase n=1 Tax=Microbispora corallina TaxID=83302 RepID=A0ABQ4FXL9_9ACTN|nr:sensor histidine kinase [Microbispora corallina]GIH39547.1 two-component sensor histidine kinase [Microbispora corallina]
MDADRGWRGYLPDAALAAAVGGALLGGIVLAPVGAAPGPLEYLALLAGTLAVVAWRRAPLPALAVATACMLAFSARVHPETSAAFPVLITAYSVARDGRRIAAAGASALFLGGTLLADLSAAGTGDPRAVVQRAVLLVGWFVAANVGGVVSRQRQAYLRQAEERAAEAERTREEAALRRAGEERLRIARELHDSLTHSISIIKVQAGVAVHLARKRGEDVPPALLAIQEASGDAMRELRATLEVLRDPGEEAANGVGRIGELADRARAAGVPVSLDVSGDRRELPGEVDRTAYRIVQEALTNVARHAGPAASAAVGVEYGPDVLTVRVHDDGRAAPDGPPVPGVGLTGMRERVAALGGRLSAGPRPGGGFSVEAELPLSPAPGLATATAHPAAEATAAGTAATAHPVAAPAAHPGHSAPATLGAHPAPATLGGEAG